MARELLYAGFRQDTRDAQRDLIRLAELSLRNFLT